MKHSCEINIKATILLFLFISAAALASPSSAEIVKGTISVASTPQGADIYLNDENIGRQTNAVITDVFPGIHYIRLEMPGYKTWEQIFEVREGQITHVSHSMERAAGDAFTITTKPRGAQIFIDGNFEGYSNVVLYSLPAGQHTVLLTLDNYSDYQKTVMISEDMSQSLSHTFETIPTTGEIIFESNPSNAEIYLNGEYIGDTRKTLKETQPGTYEVLIKKAGYDDWRGIVDVAAGKISEVKANLLVSEVMLYVDTAPPEAEVFFDGVSLGKTPLGISVQQGLHNISIEKFGYDSVFESLRIGPEGASLSYALVSRAPQAIKEAKTAIAQNLIYNPSAAQALLEKAEHSLSEGDAEGAIGYAQSAILKAFDVDDDGVVNSLDMSPNINNIIIYVSPVIAFVLLTGLFASDIIRHRVRPEIFIDIPKNINESDMLARGHVSADVSGGPFRAFVCTVYIDGAAVDHFTDPGIYDIMLSGRGPGVHVLTAHLQIAKKRYGHCELKSEETFTVAAPDNKDPAIAAGEKPKEIQPKKIPKSITDNALEAMAGVEKTEAEQNVMNSQEIIDTEIYSEELEKFYEPADK